MSNTLQRVKDARVWLSARIPFLGYVATRLRPRLAEPQDRVPTAGVAPDGSLVLNEEWVSKLTDPQLRFLVAHEVMHPAFGIFERRQHRNPLLFNIAHDFVINGILQDFSAGVGKGMEFIEGGCLDRQYDSMSAEEVYDKLLEENKGNTGGIIDNWGGALAGDCRSDLSSTEAGQAAHRGDQSAQREIDKEWQTAVEAGRQVHEAQLGQGSLPARLAQLLDEIKDPKVSWQTVLSEWLGENGCKADTTYQRPSRRSESAGEILPGVLKTGLPDVTILWDTSGSMHGTAGEILSEVASITGELGLTVRLIICDAAVHADVEGLDKAEDFIPHISGGGGSDFSPAFDVLRGEGNTSVVVAFTDGYIGVPQTQPEALGGVLWVITDRGVRPATWGQAIRLTSDGYAEGA
jgi:predicted metal-dependent peptidase